ncbi:MAG: hypothetical protein ACOZQL_10050 [Myxococcota bacterium]
MRAKQRGAKEGALCASWACSADCSKQECGAKKDPADFVAVCLERRCEALPKDHECRVDADCRLVEVPATDGGCPEKVAQPRDAGVVSVKQLARCPGEQGVVPSCSGGRCRTRVPIRPAKGKL